MTFEAVRFEGSAEVDWIDPLKSIEFYDDHFTLYNGDWGYDFPLSDYNNWKFRPVNK